MARFRKNDFFKWAQKIKSVFCFIPHTHEGCDVTYEYKNPKTKVSIHTPTKGVTLSLSLWLVVGVFQSTHPRRV